MEERVEFRRDQLRTLITGLAFLGGAIWLFWTWWDAMYGISYGNRDGLYRSSRSPATAIIPAVICFGGGLWYLAKLLDTSVKVAVDRHGITDFREMKTPIPWAEVERIEHLIIHKARGFRKPRGLRLVLRAGSLVANRHQGTSEIVVWQNGLDGGPLGLKLAVARLAPQVPRNWTDAQI